MTLFFCGNLTQTALKLIIQHTQLFTHIQIPKTFDQLISRIEEELNYDKVWFCQTCNTEVKLDNNKQRYCKKCFDKYIKNLKNNCF